MASASVGALFAAAGGSLASHHRAINSITKMKAAQRSDTTIWGLEFVRADGSPQGRSKGTTYIKNSCSSSKPHMTNRGGFGLFRSQKLTVLEQGVAT